MKVIKLFNDSEINYIDTNIELYGVTIRPYDPKTEIYSYYDNKKDFGPTVVVPINKDVEIYELFKNKLSLRGYLKRTRLTCLGDNKIQIDKLLPRKSQFNEGNFESKQYEFVCVGDKRPTTHLGAGLIFQLQLIK